VTIDWENPASLHNWIEKMDIDVCSSGIQFGLLGSMFFIGWVVSLFFVPYLGDKYGRKWLYVVGMWLTVVIYFGILLTHSIVTTIVLMFFYGVANGMRNSLGFVYMLEFVCEKH
jgi:MFS family permease